MVLEVLSDDEGVSNAPGADKGLCGVLSSEEIKRLNHSSVTPGEKVCYNGLQM